MTTESLAAAPRPGLASLALGILVRPRRTLQAVAEHNGRGWWLPGLLVLALAIASLVVSGPITARTTREQLAKMQEEQVIPGGAVNPEQLQQTLEFATSPVFTVALPATFNALGLAAGWLVQAGLLYLGAIALGGRARFGAVWGITLWSSVPFALRSLVQTVYIASRGELIANPGLSGLLQAPAGDPLAALSLPLGQQALSAVLGQVDLFVVWHLILLVIGLAAAARFTHRKAILIVLVYWVLSLGLAAIVAVAGASLASGVM